MDNANPSYPPYSSLRSQPTPTVGDPETVAHSDFRAGPYFPTFRTPQRKQSLHPVLTAAYDLEPAARPEYHIRIHPALANADLRSRYSTDPEVHVPRPLFSSSNSQGPSSSISSSDRVSKGKSRSSTTGTSVADSIAPSSSSRAKAIMDEIDAEISIRRDNQGRPLWMNCDAATKSGHEDIEEKSDMQMPDIRELFSAPKPPTESKVPTQAQVPATSQHGMAKVSISNLRELTVAEANARVQAFKASSDYQSYRSEQKSIFENPRRANAAAKERVAEFKTTPSFTRYAADLALILEHGDENDVAIISMSHSSRTSPTMPNALADGTAAGKRRQRFQGPLTQIWTELGSNRAKEEMWD